MVEWIGSEPQIWAKMTMVDFEWKESWNLLFRRCEESDTLLIPFTKVFKGTREINGPVPSITEHRWLSSKSYIYLKLKGDV